MHLFLFSDSSQEIPCADSYRRLEIELEIQKLENEKLKIDLGKINTKSGNDQSHQDPTDVINQIIIEESDKHLKTLEEAKKKLKTYMQHEDAANLEYLYHDSNSQEAIGSEQNFWSFKALDNFCRFGRRHSNESDSEPKNMVDALISEQVVKHGVTLKKVETVKKLEDVRWKPIPPLEVENDQLQMDDSIVQKLKAIQEKKAIDDDDWDIPCISEIDKELEDPPYRTTQKFDAAQLEKDPKLKISKVSESWKVQNESSESTIEVKQKDNASVLPKLSIQKLFLSKLNEEIKDNAKHQNDLNFMKIDLQEPKEQNKSWRDFQVVFELKKNLLLKKRSYPFEDEAGSMNEVEYFEAASPTFIGLKDDSKPTIRKRTRRKIEEKSAKKLHEKVQQSVLEIILIDSDNEVQDKIIPEKIHNRSGRKRNRSKRNQHQTASISHSLSDKIINLEDSGTSLEAELAVSKSTLTNTRRTKIITRKVQMTTEDLSEGEIVDTEEEIEVSASDSENDLELVVPDEDTHKAEQLKRKERFERWRRMKAQEIHSSKSKAKIA